jgi:dCTP deaminase
MVNHRRVVRLKQAPPKLIGSVLSRRDILKRLEKGDLTFTPNLEPSAIKQCSVDLRLGKTFTVFNKPGHVAAFRIGQARAMFDLADLWEQKQEEFVTLRPHNLVLAQTLEVVHLPNDLMGLIEGRSSWARFGVGIHVTAPKIDPGYNQPITLELFNLSETAYELEPEKDQPCQLMLVRVSTPLKSDEMYGSLPGDFFADQSTPVPGRKRKR